MSGGFTIAMMITFASLGLLRVVLAISFVGWRTPRK